MTFPPTTREKRTGLVRHIHARQSRADRKILLTLVLNCTPETQSDTPEELAELILVRDETIVGVAINYNDRPGNASRAIKSEVIAGSDSIVEVLKNYRRAAAGAVARRIVFQTFTDEFLSKLIRNRLLAFWRLFIWRHILICRRAKNSTWLLMRMPVWVRFHSS